MLLVTLACYLYGNMKGVRFLFLMLWWPLVAAQTPFASSVVRNEALVHFPQDIVFQLDLDPSVTLTEAVLTYDVARFSCLEASSSVPVAVTGILTWRRPAWKRVHLSCVALFLLDVLIATDVLLSTGERLTFSPGSKDDAVRRLAL